MRGDKVSKVNGEMGAKRRMIFIGGSFLAVLSQTKTKDSVRMESSVWQLTPAQCGSYQASLLAVVQAPG
jgi:Mg2+/citrate symporter